MIKIPTKVVIEIEAGKGRGVIYAGDEVLVSTDGSVNTVYPWTQKPVKQEWKDALRKQCDSIESDDVNFLIEALTSMDKHAREAFAAISYALEDMHNIHNGDE